MRSINIKPKAIILLSGGLDSTTCLAYAMHHNYDCYVLTFDYGQKAKYEVMASINICKKIGISNHVVFNLDIGQFKGSALTDPNVSIPINQLSDDIPITYVPARNTIFMSIALGWAEIVGSYNIFIGANEVDYSGYPDCREVYLKAFESLANLATKAGVSNNNKFIIQTPLLKLNKAEIISLGIKLGVDYSNTISCYQPNEQGYACRKCASCILRIKGFEDVGILDPTKYYEI